jgi:hypothetical protein
MAAEKTISGEIAVLQNYLDEHKELHRIGLCELPVGPSNEDVRGYWIKATCAEYQSALADAGGLPEMHVWSSLTDMSGQKTGSPFVFTCYGTNELPVAASGGRPGMHVPCESEHAVFVEAPNG